MKSLPYFYLPGYGIILTWRSLVRILNWNQTNSQGSAVAAGTYTLLANFTPLTLNGTNLSNAELATFVSNPISITISP